MTTHSFYRILLVEDDDTARLSLERVLTQSGYQVEAVANGEEALSLLERSKSGNEFDIVLTDLLLREVDGIEVLKKARTLPFPPEVVLLTGYGTMQTAIEALRSDAFDYLLKPCKPTDLLSCIRRAAELRAVTLNQNNAIRTIAQGLAQFYIVDVDKPTRAETTPTEVEASSARSPSIIKIGALTIDQRNRTVTFAGRSPNLTPTEYALLMCLADAKGSLISYNAIVYCVYQQRVDQATAHQLLKTHIHNLRHKLDPAYIQNVRSTGYRLIHPPAD
ncbi:MAG: response regulator transcription factor [Oscillochloris sp.]|nr:response regulator transcription factor [Oscillochloris sp.]